jgi:glycosyltransferase involved in cell wall biosynthesis
MTSVPSEKITKKKVAVVSHDKIGHSMAGPGIRYHYMAEELAITNDVTIATFDETYLPGDDFKKSYAVRHIDLPNYKDSLKDFDIVIAYWLSREMLEYLKSIGIFVIIDMYCVAPVENLAGMSLFSNKEKVDASDSKEYVNSLEFYRDAMRFGDAFLYSNKRQLDFWLGFLFCLPEFSIEFYSKRSIYDRFVEAPMGIDLNEKTSVPIKGREFLKDKSSKDIVVLWTGGVWNHFDAGTVVRAIGIASNKNPNIKLYFPGTEHPNPSVKPSKELSKAISLSKELGLFEKNIFFMKGWVEYKKRLGYLQEADLAVYSHKSSIETEFAHRTRFLDHISAGIPTVATEGDYFADQIGFYQLGLVIPTNDPDAMAEAIIKLSRKDAQNRIRENILKIRDNYSWSNTLKELVELISSGPDPLGAVEVESGQLLDSGYGYLSELRKFTGISIDMFGRQFGKVIKKLRR